MVIRDLEPRQGGAYPNPQGLLGTIGGIRAIGAIKGLLLGTIGAYEILLRCPDSFGRLLSNM